MATYNDYPYGNNKFDPIRGTLFKYNIKPKRIHMEYYLALERRLLKLNFPYIHHAVEEKFIVSGALSTMNKRELKDKIMQLLRRKMETAGDKFKVMEIEMEMKWFNIEGIYQK